MSAPQKKPINLTTMHGVRVAEKNMLRATGRAVTMTEFVWRCECLVIPDQIRAKAVKGLSSGWGYIWLRTAGKRAMWRWAREAKYHCEFIRTEIRACALCGRIMLGIEAQEHRTKLEYSYNPEREECGPGCMEKYERRKRRA